jgi:hypothetical protein
VRLSLQCAFPVVFPVCAPSGLCRKARGEAGSALWRPIPLTSRGAEKECGPCDNGRWVPRRLRTAEIRVRLPTNAAAIPGLQVHWIPRHCIRSFGFRCMISSSELLAAAFFRSVPRQAEYTWWASKMSWSVVASPAVLRRAFGASPWSPCHPRKSGARGKSRHNLFAQMKSGQDSADEVALPSQDRKGPSGLTSKRIKKVFGRIVVGRNFHAIQDSRQARSRSGEGNSYRISKFIVCYAAAAERCSPETFARCLESAPGHQPQEPLWF